jgi:hypothetical protein
MPVAAPVLALKFIDDPDVSFLTPGEIVVFLFNRYE